jgi:hypothetical protein
MVKFNPFARLREALPKGLLAQLGRLLASLRMCQVALASLQASALLAMTLLVLASFRSCQRLARSS